MRKVYYCNIIKKYIMIKHLVIPGGAIYGFSFYGALKELTKNGTLDINNIQTIHATSVGCILAVFLSLKYSWDDLDNYVINRPWQTLFQFSFQSILSSFANNGIFDISIIKEILLPLFNAKDISIDISMKDFYDLCKIELHFFSIDLLSFTLIDISYKQYPQWSVVEAIYASACAPILFKPFIKDKIIYVDGGLLSNCPINELINNTNLSVNPDEVFYINTDNNNNNNDVSYLTDFNLVTYIIFLFTKVITHHSKIILHKPIIQCVSIKLNLLPAYDIISLVNSKIHRIDLIDHGIQCVKNMQKNKDKDKDKDKDKNKNNNDTI